MHVENSYRAKYYGFRKSRNLINRQFNTDEGKVSSASFEMIQTRQSADSNEELPKKTVTFKNGRSHSRR